MGHYLFSESYEEKYNGRKQPLLASQDIKETHFKDKIQNIDALYPYLILNLDILLLQTGITKLIPKTVFENKYHRLSFYKFNFNRCYIMPNNFISFNQLVVIFMQEFWHLFYYFSDVFLIHNNYVYQSHTISGIFFVFFPGYLFISLTKLAISGFFLFACA